MIRKRLPCFVAAIALVVGAPASASETVSYTYDALGRLVANATVGGPNDTRRIVICYDRAGNRVRYDVGTSALDPCAPLPPV